MRKNLISKDLETFGELPEIGLVEHATLIFFHPC
jgi:hypothetical protein